MGQEESTMQAQPQADPQNLSERSLRAVADYILNYIEAENTNDPQIVVLTGAGVSTSAGIPDFRSPKTGLYANLQRLNLPYPEAVFDLEFFRKTPEPFYALAKALYPGKFYPTVSHAFIRLLEQKSLLKMVFTQNIDTLESRAGVSPEKIIEAHGSFASQRCIDCKTQYPQDDMIKAVEASKVPHCVDTDCNGLVKPDIVFFGEGLPNSFFENMTMVDTADLVIVMGTSLEVAPFAHLPGRTRDGVPRLLLNRERVGDFGTRSDDVVHLGDCDAGVRSLADALGWRKELDDLYGGISGPAAEEGVEKVTEEAGESLGDSQNHGIEPRPTSPSDGVLDDLNPDVKKANLHDMDVNSPHHSDQNAPPLSEPAHTHTQKPTYSKELPENRDLAQPDNAISVLDGNTDVRHISLPLRLSPGNLSDRDPTLPQNRPVAVDRPHT